MIFSSLDTVAYRVHDPKWAYAPTSGSGAGTSGGRANRPGINALYLSLELETALVEYKQMDALLQPALMVTYCLKVEHLVDFSGGYTNDWDPLWQDFYCDWRRMYYNEEIEPPSWVIGDQVLATGGRGIIFKSVITGGTNVVLFNDVLSGTDIIEAYDPNHSLPKNQDSWI